MEDNDILDNENFKKWFGQSLIVDDNDDPLVVYHGTTANFYTFDLSKSNHEAFAGSGFYFSSSPDDAEFNYASMDSPDLKSKKEQFVEGLESLIDIVEPEFYEENEIEESLNNFNAFVLQLSSENDTYYQKINKIHEYINEEGLLLLENDSETLKNAFSTIINQTNDGITHAVYLKMEKPFFLEKQEWEKSFSVSDEITETFSQFLVENPESELLIKTLLDNLQYYATVEDDNQLSIDKSSFFEMIDVDLDDILDVDYDDSVYSRESLLKLSEYWNNEIGEDEYLTGGFDTDDVVEKFKSFVNHNYGELFSGRDLEELHKLSTDSEIVHAETFFNDIQNNLSFLYDYMYEGISSSNVFFAFIYSLGFDGIVMNANRFQNMNIIDGTMHYIVREPNQIKLADSQNTEFSLDNDDIRFKKVLCKPELSISQNEAFSTVEQFHIAFPNLPYTRIFQTQKDIEHFTKTKDTVAGFYSKDNKKPFVGIVLENIKSTQQLERVLVHEHLGHASLRNILGQEYESTMLNIFHFLDKKNAIEVNPNWKNKDKVEVAEEFFANSMENKNEFTNSLLTKVTSAICKIIRSVFKNFPFNKDEFSILQEKSHNHAKVKTKTTMNL